MTLNMFPCLSFDYIADGSVGCIKRPRYRRLLDPFTELLANISNLTIGKSNHAMAGPSSLTTLADLVVHIVSLRAEKKVRRINARRVVAAMKNEYPFRYWGDEHGIASSMSIDCFTFSRTKISIAKFFSEPRPLPTSSWRYFYFIHEFFQPDRRAGILSPAMIGLASHQVHSVEDFLYSAITSTKPERRTMVIDPNELQHREEPKSLIANILNLGHGSSITQWCVIR